MNRDTLTILGLSLGSCLVVTAISILVLRRVRRSSLTTLLVVAGLIPLLALAVATSVNVHQMFLSGHDSLVTSLVLVSGVPAAVLTAVMLGHWLTRGSRALVAAVGSLDSTTPAGPHAANRGVVPGELALVVDELAEVRTRLAASRQAERALESGHRDLIAFLSHDLRTPLAGIRALAEGLEDGVLEDVPAALADLRAGTERLDRMVSDLFELSRNAPGGAAAVAPRILLDLQEIVDDAAAELGHVARTAGVELVVDVEPRLAVYADPESLGRAVSNLLDNAVRHTRSGGRVTVSGHHGDPGEVHLGVRDECGGIASADLPRVFDIGWRGDADRGTRTRGAGLGLAIVRHVVRAHEGVVAVRNAGAGCEFDVVIPGRAGPTRDQPRPTWCTEPGSTTVVADHR
ncbi:MAG: sensor histidine kinase [Janthinobacterium lividum]